MGSRSTCRGAMCSWTVATTGRMSRRVRRGRSLRSMTIRRSVRVRVRVVIRGAVFHDMTNRNCSAAHMDCLQVAAADGMVIEGNKFRGCFSNDLILTGDFGVMNNITLQNNWFGPTLTGNVSLNWNPTRDCPGAVVRYNTFVGSGCAACVFAGQVDADVREHPPDPERVELRELAGGAARQRRRQGPSRPRLRSR